MTTTCVRVAIVDARLREHVLACLDFEGVRLEERDAPATVVLADRQLDAGALPVVLVRASSAPEVVPGDGRLAATLTAPLRRDSLLLALHAAQQLAQQDDFAWSRAERDALRFPRVVGTCVAVRRLREQMGKVVDHDTTVLVSGESGVGKTLVARAIHDASHRAAGPFVPVDCSALPVELVESALFGNEMGAFAGAVVARPGRFELADGGTIVLEEVGSLPLGTQTKLLRVLQDRTFERLGGVESIRCDVRVIATTTRDLAAMSERGEFRNDLYYRLDVFPLEVPSLRDRAEDVPMLVAHFCDTIAAARGHAVRFGAPALQLLTRQRWAGNVRELANLVERLVITKPGAVIGVEDLPARYLAGTDRPSPGPDRRPDVRVEGSQIDVPDSDPADRVDALHRAPLLPVNGIDLKAYLNGLEKSLIQQALDDSNSIVARAADRLHVRRTTLVEKMRKYGLQRGDTADA